MTGSTADQLRSIIERIEALNEERRSVGEQVREVLAEAKGNGFDTKAIQTIVRLRAKDSDVLAEEEAILETYKSALGML